MVGDYVPSANGTTTTGKGMAVVIKLLKDAKGSLSLTISAEGSGPTPTGTPSKVGL